MDRLKKEWRETQIPREIRLRAKNRAWEKMRRPVYRKKNGVLAFASCAIALAALFVMFRSGPEDARVPPVHSDQWSVVGGQESKGRDQLAEVREQESGVRGQLAEEMPFHEAVVSHPVALVSRLEIPEEADVMPAFPAEPDSFAINPTEPDDFAISPESGTVLFEMASSETDSLEADYEPSRVVFNFILPESGARLIWLASSNH